MPIYFPFSYTVPADAFLDPEGEEIFLRHELDPNNFLTTFDATTRTVSGILEDNSLDDEYKLLIYAEDIHNLTYVKDTVKFRYYQNEAPTALASIPTPD